MKRQDRCLTLRAKHTHSARFYTFIVLFVLPPPLTKFLATALWQDGRKINLLNTYYPLVIATTKKKKKKTVVMGHITLEY